jgi:hypothetical protein
MSKTHPMRVCERCNFAMYHPILYCPRCPGRMKLVQRDIPHPDSFRTEQDIKDHLKTQGLDYFGEYPKFPKQAKVAE